MNAHTIPAQLTTIPLKHQYSSSAATLVCASKSLGDVALASVLVKKTDMEQEDIQMKIAQTHQHRLLICRKDGRISQDVRVRYLSAPYQPSPTGVPRPSTDLARRV
ncbi:hypothetical protein OIDMADRAFT_178460 [Oidiodendron maius Zn]|uniref:Uncharacterized protein n=1 Tax=Oidiodendron maius (strain Zn) TaxID=913774 RepID=A0A0C3HHB7_OIDMZ|nr:hypothetical protein OIDMADRAFT_178460 [Oidiodendron maius Zn]